MFNCVLPFVSHRCLPSSCSLLGRKKAPKKVDIDDEMQGELEFERKSSVYFNPFIFLPPAMCDMTATSLMYVGLTLTYASSYQMLRGSVIVFTGLASVIFLRRRIPLFQWGGMVILIIGLILVGIASVQQNSGGAPHPLIGDILVIVAQVVVAIQMVIEEKFVVGKDVPPLAAVGWEGIFGFSVLSLLLIPMYYIHVGPVFSSNPDYRLEDVIDGYVQFVNSPIIMGALIVNVTSIAFFNFAGISVTKELSATTRMMLDSLRTFIIWIYSLLPGVNWQTFSWLQLLGFVVMLVGTCVYNDLVFLPLARKYLGPRLRGYPSWISRYLLCIPVADLPSPSLKELLVQESTPGGDKELLMQESEQH